MKQMIHQNRLMNNQLDYLNHSEYLKIVDNQIMNFNNRADFLPGILSKLNGLEYYTNDFVSTGVTYYDICDKYNVKIGENIYSCVMFNDEVLVTQGLEENIYTELPEQTETDYTKADKTDRKINYATLIVDKQNNLIQGVVESVEGYDESITEIKQTSNDINLIISKITKNINTETGDIESVKTTTGYTFDKDGLKIKKDVNDYNTLIDNTGTYYKDGDTILSQTTKDGTITKDMVLYGKYYYGVREDLDVANFKKDDAMFVAELYTDNNGEEGFGHFYNGGDM